MPSAINIGKPNPRRGTWLVKHYGVTAAQTFKVGDLVYLDSNGTLVIAAAASNDVGNVKIQGVALANAADILANPSGNLAECPVACPTRDAEIALQLYHSTAASAVYAASDQDAPITLPLRNQAGVWVANVENDGTNDRVQLTSRHKQYPFSEQYGWFWFKFLSAGTLEGD